MTAKGSGRRRRIPSTVLDVAIAFAAVAAVFLAMFIYSGIWPPLVVVESKSMQHSPTMSHIGTMDTGDLVLIRMVKNERDIVTWLSGNQTGHQTYGAHGDVIVYRRGGSDEYTPIIHRAVMYLEANLNGTSYRASELRNYVRNTDYSFQNSSNTWEHITGDLALNNYGHDSVTILIPVGRMIREFEQQGAPLHSGFITKGDFNAHVDQMMGIGFTTVPVPIDWVIGKARGEIPWFGIMKLWLTGTLPADAPSNSIRNLMITIVLLIAVPLSVELAFWLRARGQAVQERALESHASTSAAERAPAMMDAEPLKDEPPEGPSGNNEGRQKE